MASLSKPPPTYLHRQANPISLYSSPSILSFSFNRTVSLHPRLLCALRFGADGSDLLRRPTVPPVRPTVPPERPIVPPEKEEDEDSEGNKKYKEEEAWEDQILEDTVPLVGFVRMILHSDKYPSGQRLSPEHERTIRERLLPYHPECEKKIGCGIDYITVGYHPDFEFSRCLFIVRKDGEFVDFSYWKCIKGLIRKKYPLYSDSFILRHFRQRRRSG